MTNVAFTQHHCPHPVCCGFILLEVSSIHPICWRLSLGMYSDVPLFRGNWSGNHSTIGPENVAVFYKDSEQSLMLDFIGRMCGRWYGIGCAGDRVRFLETGMESVFIFQIWEWGQRRVYLFDKMNFVTPVRRGMACHAPANRSTRRAL